MLNSTKNMLEMFDGYNEIFSKWTSQKMKINDLETEILYLEADLKGEEQSNTAFKKHEIEKAVLELEAAQALAVRLEGNKASAEIELQLERARKELRSCQEFYDFVISTFEEQNKLWEVAYKRCTLHIGSLQERLIAEKAMLDFYAAELQQWKHKIHTAEKEVS